MHYQHHYKISADSTEDESIISISSKEIITRELIKFFEPVILESTLRNKEVNHSYFWGKDNLNDLYLFSQKDPIDLFGEYYLYASNNPKQAYEFTLSEGLVYINENVGSMERYANKYCLSQLDKQKNLIIFTNNEINNFGYVFFKYFNEDIKEIDDSKFFLIISNKRYSFEGFKLLEERKIF